MRNGWRLIFLAYVYLIVKVLFVGKTVFSSRKLYWRSIGHTCVGPFWILFCPTESEAPLCQRHTVLVVQLKRGLKAGGLRPPTPFFSFRVVLAIWDPLDFHINFRMSLSISMKNPARIWIRIASSTVSFRRTDVLTIWSRPVHHLHGSFIEALVSFISFAVFSTQTCTSFLAL